MAEDGLDFGEFVGVACYEVEFFGRHNVRWIRRLGVAVCWLVASNREP